MPLTLRYTVVLVVLALLAVASYVTLDRLIGRQQDDGALINRSGQQRMLSQRLELLAERLVRQPDASARDALARAAVLMAENHEVLVRAAERSSAALVALYFGPEGRLDRDVRAFLAAAHAVVSVADANNVGGADSGAALALLRRQAGEGLLERLDGVVRQHQRENAAAVAELSRMALLEMGIALAVLAFSAVGVFRPLVRRIEKDVAGLQEAQERLRGILDSALDAIVSTDASGAVTEFNRSAEAMFGFRFEAVRGRNIADLIIPEQVRARHRAGMQRHTDGLAGDFLNKRVEVTARRADGSEFPVELAITAIGAGERKVYTAFLRDLTAHRQAEDTLRKLSRAVEQSPAAVIITDTAGTIDYVNLRFVELTGYPSEAVIGLNPRLLDSGCNPPEVFRDLWRTITSGQEWRGDLHNRRKDGSCFWQHVTISPIRGPSGDIAHFVAIQEDLTARKQYEEQLLRQSHFDAVTGLPNRLLALDRLSQQLARAHRQRGMVALMLIDLDHFKLVNDSLGHEAGDRVLVEAARRLTACVREADTVARLGGDEFLVILPDLESVEAVEIVAQRVLAAFAEPFLACDCHHGGDHGGDVDVVVTASIGLTLYPDDGDAPSVFIRNGETAMYQAKEAGRNSYRFFTPEMNQGTAARMALETRLRHALARDELFLLYQPMVDPRSGRVVGAEALMRWRNPDLGLVTPDRFIPPAEMTGLIVPMGAWALRAACREARIWGEAAGRPVRVAVNVSPWQFRKGDLVATVAQALDDSGLAPGLLELEITEGLLLDDGSGTMKILTALAEMGVQLSIDDFGTGYSSLRYLKQFSVDILKIDRSFIQDIPPGGPAVRDDGGDDGALVTAIIAMAHGLGLSVVGEGVETKSQLEFLQARHCDVVQGFLFSRPLPPADFMEVIRQGTIRYRP